MNFKPLLTLFTAMALTAAPAVADDAVVELPAPNKARTTLTVMQAFEQRRSTRDISAERPLKPEDLADLLWAANGINRPESGKRTAPSAMDRRDVDVYVVQPEGIFVYDPAANALRRVAEGDHRALVAGGQKAMADVPVFLLLVTDLAKFGGRGDRDAEMGAVDVGIVSQNISLFCAAAGLATVPRGSMDADKLRQVMGLKDSQRLTLNHPVGYFK